VHRKEEGNGDTSAEAIFGAGGDPALTSWLAPATAAAGGEGAAVGSRRTSSALAFRSVEEWQAEWDRVLALGRRPVAVSATRLAEEALMAASGGGGTSRSSIGASDEVASGEDSGGVLAGLRKDARDIELPPWQRGRYGSAIGRAVHGVMQSVDLATGAGLARLCASQAAAEGLLGKEDVIEALCRSGLESAVVAEASRSEHWREMYVGVPYGDGVLEGYIDLLYRSEDGLVVVDYKTDSWRTDANLDEKAKRYQLQLDAYRRAVVEITGEAVVVSNLLFLKVGSPARSVPV
jgi:hypothetical protein